LGVFPVQIYNYSRVKIATDNIKGGSMKTKRAERVKNWSLEDAVFIPVETPLLQEAEIRQFSIANISSTGIALWGGEGHKPLPPGYNMKGTLNIADSSFEISVKVLYNLKHITGCTYDKPPEGLDRFIQQHYPIEIKADRMVHVRESLLEKHPLGTPHLYSDGGENRLYLVENNGKLEHYRLDCGEIEVSREQSNPPQYRVNGAREELDNETTGKLTRLLHHVSDLPQIYKKEILSEIEWLNSDKPDMRLIKP